MGFSFVYNDFGAAPRRVDHIPPTDNEAFIKGEAIKVANGRITKAAAGDDIAGFVTQNLAAGTDATRKIEWQIVREGDWFDVPYTGTPSAGFVLGVGTANLSTDGLSVNAANVTGGPFAVEQINDNLKTARVKVKKRQF